MASDLRFGYLCVLMLCSETEMISVVIMRLLNRVTGLLVCMGHSVFGRVMAAGIVCPYLIAIGKFHWRDLCGRTVCSKLPPSV